VTRTRREVPRRVTPELIEFYTKRAHQLRVEFYRNMWRSLWPALARIIQRD
jgi:hypothetical protein